MRVLIVEDDAAVCRIVSDQLEDRGVSIVTAGTVAASREALWREEFHAVVLDLSLPDGSGLEVLAELRAAGSSTYVIVLTGAGSEADRVNAIESGADDYVVKPFFVRELVARVLAVERRRSLAEDTSLRIGALEIDLKAHEVTTADGLIELTTKEFALLAFLAARPGHSFTRDELLRAVWQSNEDWQQSATVTEHVRRLRMKIEEDPRNPKMLKTVHGTGYRLDLPPPGPLDVGTHDAQALGDTQRLELAVSPGPSARLRHLVTGVHSELSDAVIVTDLHFHVRSWNRAAERLYGWAEHDALGRHLLDVVDWEGDEFSTAARELESTGRWHEQGRQRTRDGSFVEVTSSMTMMYDEEVEAIGVAFVNRAVVHPAVESGSAAGLDAGDLRRGLDQREFEVRYQPVVALADGTLETVEALVRWQHPVRGLLGPDEFIDAAERNGLIIELDAFVLDTASRQVASWRASGLDVGLSVNVSAIALADPHLVDRVIATLEGADLDAQSLWLEVTETSLVRNVDQAAATLHRLADHGIGIAIDDFGTGWASLTYLSKFPIHTLKIDRTFVAGINDNPNDRAIIRSIVHLGAELAMDVIAEGIETLAQSEALQGLGCVIGQGYLFGKPTLAPAVPLHLARRIKTLELATSLRHGSNDEPTAVAGEAGGVRLASRAAPASSTGEEPAAEDPDRLARSTGNRSAGNRPVEHDCISGLLRGLLRVQTTTEAIELLHQTVRQLGGQLVIASEDHTDALPIDVSLGEGPPMLVTAEPLSVARMQLERTLPRLVEDARQAIDLLRQAERLTEETNHDPLTGLANRRVLDRVLPRIDGGVIVMIDLDHFKAVNDNRGHAAGDDVLARFGQMLEDEVRPGDTTCRVGGEEFVIVLSGADMSTAAELVDRIRKTWILAAPLPITFSAGLAAVAESGGTAALLAADQAMYRAKSNGRNRTEISIDLDRSR